VNSRQKPSRTTGEQNPPAKRQRLPRLESIEGQPLYRVSIIALLGFAVGVVWPRLAGVSLVPEPPVEHSVPAEPSDVKAATGATEAPPRTITPKERLVIGPAKITSCRDRAGKQVESCGTLEIDTLLQPTLLALTECPAANGAFGMLSLGFELDLVQAKISGVQSGKSTTLPASVTKEILRCAEEGLALVSPARDKGAHGSYTIYYVLEFKTPEEVVSSESDVTPASGKGTVRWQTALIRKEPARDGEVLARLLSGSEVMVTGRHGEWYRVKYDAQGREGWVHGAALGL
jgi:hypothetical protein